MSVEHETRTASAGLGHGWLAGSVCIVPLVPGSVVGAVGIRLRQNKSPAKIANRLQMEPA